MGKSKKICHVPVSSKSSQPSQQGVGSVVKANSSVIAVAPNGTVAPLDPVHVVAAIQRAF